MKLQFTYDVQTSITLIDVWPIKLEDFEVRWQFDEDRLVAISLIGTPDPQDKPPSYRTSETPGVAGTVDTGWTDRLDDATRIVRSVQGTLSLFSEIDIDIESPEIEWIPESQQEKESLSVRSFKVSRETPDLYRPFRMPYEVVARSAFAALSMPNMDMPLNFIRHGNRDYAEGRYISSFYSYFLFLETLYAPGLSRPAEVKKRFRNSKELLNALQKARRDLSAKPPNRSKIHTLLKMGEGELIDHIVDTRGRFHHHSRCSPKAWHPDSSSDIEGEVTVIRQAAHELALAYTSPIMYSQKVQEALEESVRGAQAQLPIIIRLWSVENGESHELNVLRINCPGNIITSDTVMAAHNAAREYVQRTLAETSAVIYRLEDEQGKVLAEYTRFRLHTSPSSRQGTGRP